MSYPDPGLIRLAPAASSDQRAEGRYIFGLDEHLGKRKVRRVRGRRSQGQFQVSGDLNNAWATAVISNREVTHFGIFFWRYNDGQGSHDVRVMAYEFGAVFGKSDFVTV